MILLPKTLALCSDRANTLKRSQMTGYLSSLMISEKGSTHYSLKNFRT